MIVLFLAQTAYPHSAQIFGVTINLLASYIIFLAFILPIRRSIWYIVFAWGMLLISSSNSWLVVTLPFGYAYLISNYIHNKQTTTTISFLYLFLALIGYQLIFILSAIISGDLMYSDIITYMIKISPVDLVSMYLVSIFLIQVVGRLLRPSRQKLVLE